jgi:hypothetical protein
MARSTTDRVVAAVALGLLHGPIALIESGCSIPDLPLVADASALGSGPDATSVEAGGDDAGSAVADAGTDGSDASDGSFLIAAACTPGSSLCTDASAYAVCVDAGTAYAATVCPVDCSNVGAPHCRALYPSAPVAAADLTAGGPAPTTIAAGVTIFNTNDGSISGALTRPSNSVAGHLEVIAGVAFHQDGETGIWSFGDLTIAAGATVKVIGVDAAALVSSGTLTVRGVIDARPMDGTGTLCPQTAVAGPGGFPGGDGTCNCGPGGNFGLPGAGPGGGGAGSVNPHASGPPTPEGGGAGHAAPGGRGAYVYGSAQTAYTSGGLAYDDAGGGSAGGSSATGTGRGGGGGVVSLVARYAVSIGDGTAIEGINAGGCGGWQGGGGGSGGTIFVEAPFVQLLSQATLAANGGGGGTADPDASAPGPPGGLNASPTLGYGWAPAISGATSGCAGVGPGGAGNSPAGGDTPACAGSGGGGGAAGYVFVRTAAETPTVQGAVISPTVDSGAAVFQTADVH